MPLELTVKNGLVELASAGLSAPVLFARSLPAAHSAYFAWMDTENTTLRALEHVLAWSIRVLLSGVGAPGAASSMVGCVWDDNARLHAARENRSGACKLRYGLTRTQEAGHGQHNRREPAGRGPRHMVVITHLRQ